MVIFFHESDASQMLQFLPSQQAKSSKPSIYGALKLALGKQAVTCSRKEISIFPVPIYFLRGDADRDLYPHICIRKSFQSFIVYLKRKSIRFNIFPSIQDNPWSKLYLIGFFMVVVNPLLL